MGDQVTAAEVAEDFQASLEDLTTNDRFQINNFTVIARENTEYANEISNVLIDHIGKAKPDQKLPAIYVLDSIAKNIGSPYTIFLGHRLYTTFLQAYSSVDRPTRRRLDDVLKMWAAPVPGSLDPRPVFPPEVTGKIMKALHQSSAKAAAQVEQQQRNEQEMLRRRLKTGTPGNTWRETPTPPQASSRYPAPGYPNGQTHSPYPPAAQYPPSQQYPHIAPQYPLQPAGGLEHDIENLIRSTKEEWSLNIHNAELQIKLRALVDLQQVVRSQQLGSDALAAVREQVRALQLSSQPSRAATATAPLPSSIAATPLPFQQVVPPAISQSIAHSASTPMQYAPPPPPVVQAAAPSTNLADLLSSMQRNTPKVSTPQMSIPALAGANPSTGDVPLFAQLRAAGLLAGITPGATPQGSAPPPPPPPVASGPVNLADLLKSMSQKASTAPVTGPRAEKIELTPASMKVPRPQFINKFYEARPDQCTMCGRRFSGNEDGKKEKATHLDWHFQTNKKLSELAGSGRGLNRAWYVDELDWIEYQGLSEVLTSGTEEAADGSLLGSNSRVEDPRTRYVPVPSDHVLANAPCPICQEKFVVSRNEELQDFVWMDAVKIGGRIYHASCYADMTKDGGHTPARTATPDSVLGKRKAENFGDPSPHKMFRESTE